MVSHALIYIFGAILNLMHITLTLPDTLYKQGFNYPTPFVPRGGMTFRVLPKVKSFLKFQLCWDLCARQPPFLFFSSWERVRKGLRKKKKRKKKRKKQTLNLDFMTASTCEMDSSFCKGISTIAPSLTALLCCYRSLQVRLSATLEYKGAHSST